MLNKILTRMGISDNIWIVAEMPQTNEEYTQMINVNKLKGKIIENGHNVEQLALEMGINRATFYRKLKNTGIGFTINEAKWLYHKLNLTKEEAIAIFFNHDVAEMPQRREP